MKNIKADFPIFKRKINGSSIVYLDNGATTQKPSEVINSISGYLENNNANIHRGIYTLSEESTGMFEKSREIVGNFLGAKKREVIFTSGCTESLNTAFLFASQLIKNRAKVVTSVLEHHSNLIPAQNLVKNTKGVLKIIPIDKNGDLDYAKAQSILKEGCDIFAITHISNVTGEQIDIKKLIKLAKTANPKCLVIVDGAQAIGHVKVNVESLGCDFYAFSAHKMLGPTGVGVLWVKESLLNILNPVKFGGGMVSEVLINKATWAKPPFAFEAGTPNIVGSIGFSKAIEYLNSVGIVEVEKIIKDLTLYAVQKLSKIEGIYIYGASSKKKHGVVSFNLKGVHSHDLASVLDSCGVAIRSGHHCAMPLHTALGINSSARASFYIYNSKEDVDRLVSGIKKAKDMFGV